MNVLAYLRGSLGVWTLGERAARRLRDAFAHHSIRIVSSEVDLTGALPDCEVYWGWVFRGSWIPIATKLQWIATPAAGLDWLASPRLRETDIIVTRGAFHGKIMAQSALAMMLYFERRLGPCLAAVRTGDWPRGLLDREAGTLAGKTLCVVGAGRIGTCVGTLAAALDMRVVGVRRRETAAAPPYDRMVAAHDLSDALADADHVVVVLPATEKTFHMIGADAFAHMKPSAHFYNIGRGSCVDEEALVQALAQGRIAGAGLDVFETEPLPADSPLRRMSNVLVTPHGSAISSNYMDLAVADFADNLRRFEAGDPLENVVERTSDLWHPPGGAHSPAW